MSFELRLQRAGDTVNHTNESPLLTASDLLAVRAVTKSAWYVLSGAHKSSKIVLTVKPASLNRWLSSIGAAASRGGRVDIMVDGQSIGTMVLMQLPKGAEFEIDAGFFSNGTESERASACRLLADGIGKGIHRS